MNTISKQISEYFEDNTEVIAVYLYGSYAVGKHTLTSDIDLGIVLDSEKIELDQFTAKKDKFFLDLSRILRKEIHLVVLNTVGEGLLNQVVRKGICIYVGNKKKQTLFITMALLRIADFNYYKTILQTGFVRNVLEEKA
ncbi:nucleotidyltransferase domain-containing protein [Thermodesulfobacteriota bacterium]